MISSNNKREKYNILKINEAVDMLDTEDVQLVHRDLGSAALKGIAINAA